MNNVSTGRALAVSCCRLSSCTTPPTFQRIKNAELFVFSFTAGSWYHYIIEYKLIIMLYWYYPQCDSWWFFYQRSAPPFTYFYLHHVIQLVPFWRNPGNFFPLAVSLWHITDKGAYNRFFLYTAKGKTRVRLLVSLWQEKVGFSNISISELD